MKRRDVALVSGSFYPREGGAERQLRAVLARMTQEGMSVQVYTQAILGELDSETIQGIEVRRIGNPRMFERFPRISHVIFVGSVVVSLLRHTPKTMVTLQMGSASVAAAIVGRFRPGARRIVRLTGGGSEMHKSESYARAATRHGRLLAKVSTSGNTILAAPARHLLDDFKAVFPSIAVCTTKIPNGVKVPSMYARSLQGDIIWYSRRGSEKTASEFGEVCKRLKKYRFTVIGAPLSRSYKNVTNLGWVDNPESIIAQHKVLLNTSVREGMPNTALQALSTGVRVVGFDNAGLLELENGYPGAVRTVRAGDIGSLVESVEQAISLPELPPQDVPTDEQVYQQWKRLITDG